MNSEKLIEHVALSRLEKAAGEFSASNRHLDALECMERALVLRKRLFGLSSTTEVRENTPREG